MHRTVANWTDFRKHWAGPTNFRLTGEVAAWEWQPPPLNRIVDELRHDEGVTIKRGTRSDRLDLEVLSPDVFRAMPIERAMEVPFALAHFDLGRFDAPGRFLHGFGEAVLDPWEAALADAGFTWERCYPIAFVSGRGCATNYHMDVSHVLAWQVYGTKRFCGLRDPDRWADRGARVAYDPKSFSRPDGIREEDALCYDMRPGERLWNVLLTPHWVEAGDEVALSFNISHGGLRLNGRLSRNEAELEEARESAPERAPARVERRYR
ncbi:hypothetical protein [Roseitranquillus sediminis]|uniref:hypothetical protein n=1 Tax=Roseitranquillus sediminis TaxID=2809051 RepID=UPI001D0CA676|nr:hypothetical protein [Roseitranquillus sediminis]MBM9595449.1 hypothetical protein [Roseitranquillus sediminis]